MNQQICSYKLLFPEIKPLTEWDISKNNSNERNQCMDWISIWQHCFVWPMPWLASSIIPLHLHLLLSARLTASHNTRQMEVIKQSAKKNLWNYQFTNFLSISVLFIFQIRWNMWAIHLAPRDLFSHFIIHTAMSARQSIGQTRNQLGINDKRWIGEKSMKLW